MSAAIEDAVQLAAERLFNDYAWAIDAEEPEGLREVFAAEASFAMSVAGTDEAVGPVVGVGAIVEFFAAALARQDDRRRHAITNCRARVLARKGAEARAYLVLAIDDDAGLAVRATGLLEATLVPVDAGWRFAALTLSLDRGL